MTKGFSLGLMLLSGVTASAVYSDRVAFESATSNLSVQGFEEPFDTASSVSFPGFTVTEDSSFANVSPRTDYVSVGSRAAGFTWNGNVTLTFEFAPPIDAFAADILDFGTCCGATALRITNETNELDVARAVGGDLPRGNLQFFAAITETPFSTLTFTSDQNSTNDLIIFDEVAFRAAPVPEPSAGLLGGLEVLAATLHRRRKKQAG